VTKKYNIDPNFLELFVLAAQYGENVGVQILTLRFINLAEQGKATHSSSNGIEMTRDEIQAVLSEARKNRNNKDFARNVVDGILVGGGVLIAGIAVTSMLIVGNIASVAFLWGSGAAIGIGATMAIAGAVKSMTFSAEMPNGIKLRFSSINDEYGKPFPDPTKK
jgi:hypothetical protein